MDDKTTGTTPKTLPFNNLFLNSGFVHGINHWSIYVLTIGFTLFAYILSPVFTFIHLVFLAKQNGMSYEEMARNAEGLIDPKTSGIDMNYILIALFGIFVFTFIALWLGIRKFHHKPFLSVVTAYEKFRFKRFRFAFLLWSVIVVITVILDYSLNPDDFKIVFNLKGFLVSIFLMIILMPIQTGFEEVFFRGYLMQGFAQVFKNGLVPLLLTALLFGVGHMTNPEAEKYGWQVMLPYYAGFGLFLGALTLLDEGLELAFGIHLANNLISCILVTSNDSVLKTYSVLETSSENPSLELIVTGIMTIVAFLIFWYKYRWKNFSLIVK